MNDSQNPTVVSVKVDFILHAENQRILINILKTYSSLSLPDLSKLIKISEQTLHSVLEKGHISRSKAAELLDITGDGLKSLLRSYGFKP